MIIYVYARPTFINPIQTTIATDESCNPATYTWIFHCHNPPQVLTETSKRTFCNIFVAFLCNFYLIVFLAVTFCCNIVVIILTSSNLQIILFYHFSVTLHRS